MNKQQRIAEMIDKGARHGSGLEVFLFENMHEKTKTAIPEFEAGRGPCESSGIKKLGYITHIDEHAGILIMVSGWDKVLRAPSQNSPTWKVYGDAVHSYRLIDNL